MADLSNALKRLVEQPSRYPGDESHHYRPTAELLLGERDELADQVENFCIAVNDVFPTAEEASAALMSLFTPTDEPPKKKESQDA